MNKRQLIDSLAHETHVAKHLFSKLPHGQAALDYRPAPGQRSTLELMRYLACSGIGSAASALAGTFEAFMPHAKATEKMTAAELAAALDRQLVALKALIGGIPDADYEGKDLAIPPVVSGKTCEVLVNTTLKFMTAYRMQLFLYAKAAGAKEIDTWDCWRGQTRPPAAARKA
jgi:hypothetical protein